MIENMKPYCVDFREKVIKAYERGDTSIRKLAARFDVSKAFVQRILKQKKLLGHVQPQKQGGGMKSELKECSKQLAQMVEKYPEATLGEYCEYWGETYGALYSTSTMCRALQIEQLTRKKRCSVALNAQLRECKNFEANTGSKSRTFSPTT